MFCRGIRGATVADLNTRETILAETQNLLESLIRENNLSMASIASIFFSTTTDLNAEFPALAARHLGLVDTPLLCFHEMNVAGSLPKCIRILIHVNSEKPQSEMKHLYLKEAASLRPDLLAAQAK